MDHTFKFPSAVNLSLLQLPQNCSDIEVMKPTCIWTIISPSDQKPPTWPRNPGTFHPLDVSFGASSTRRNVGNVFLMISNIS